MKYKIIFILMMSLFLLSLVSSLTISVKPLSVMGFVQPSTTFQYQFNLTSDALCTNVLYTNISNITTGTDGIGTIDLNISTLSGIPIYLCEYKGSPLVLRKVHLLSDQVFNNIYAQNINLSGSLISQGMNVTAFNSTMKSYVDSTFFNNISNFTGTLTDTKYCKYDSASNKIVCDSTIVETLWNANYSTFLTHIDWATSMNGTLAKTTDLVNYNSSGLIKDWNISGLIKDFNSSGLIINWSLADLNATGLVKDWNSTNLIINWNSTGLIKDFNASNLIKDWNSTGLIANWSVVDLNATGLVKDWNSTGLIKDDNSTGFIKNWTVDINSANSSATSWVDSFFPQITELVGLIGNWTADKVNYYTKGDVTQNITDTNTSMKNYVDLLNNTGLIKDWNSSGLIINYNGTNLIIDWNSTGYIKDFNSTGYIKNWNASGLLANWSVDLSPYLTAETLWNANYSTFLTHIDWAKAINGTLMKSADWNATNTSYMLASNWNATNTSYYLASNPSGFYNVTNAPTYINDTFGANYSTYLTKPTWTIVMNGTLMLSSNWNATNTSYMLASNWNATNTSYYLASNPSGFYNVTNAPIYINDTFSANYSTFLTHIDWAKAINGTLMKSADWNATNTSYALLTTLNNGSYLNVDWNSSGLIKDWNATGYIKDWLTSINSSGLIKDWNSSGLIRSWSASDWNSSGLIKDWNATGLIKTWTDTDTFVANYSTFLTHIDWAKAINGTLMKSADWNATNTSYMLWSNIINGTLAEQNKNVTFENITSTGYIEGQPITGMLGSGIIWANGTNNFAEVVVTCTGLSCSYTGFKVRLVNTSNYVKYCDIPAGSFTQTDNQQSVWYVDNSCNIQETTFANYIATPVSPGGIADFANVIAENGNTYDVNGIGIENKRIIKLRKLMLETVHLDVVTGFTRTTSATFPQFNISTGRYVYLMDVVPTTLQQTSVDKIEAIYHTGASTWASSEKTGLNITTCDTGTGIATCTNTNRWRRVFIFMIGYNDSTSDTTKLHQLLPSQSTTYGSSGTCLDTTTNPLTYTLPAFYQYGAVMLYAYCARPADTSWTTNFIDLRTVKQSTATAGFDTSIFLTQDGTVPLTANWNQGEFNLTNESSWFLGKVNYSSIQNAPNLNSTGLIKDWNSSGLIKDFNSTGLIKNWTTTDYNSTGLIKDWNASGYIKDDNATGLIRSWSASDWNSSGLIKDWNTTGYIKDWNASGLIKTWTDTDTFVANYSTFLTHIDWSKAINGTLMLSANWNATNTSYMLASNWNATNTSYYLVSNPNNYYNSTSAPIYINDTFGANYSTYLTKPTWSTVMNGTLMLSANWNSTNTSYALDSKVNSIGNWTADKTSYGTWANVMNGTVTAGLINWANAINGTLANNSYVDGKFFSNLTNFTGTLTNAKYCVYDSGTQKIVCNSESGAITESDPYWVANYSDYLTIRNYALNDTNYNSSGLIKDWNASGLIKTWTDTDTFVANYSTYLGLFNWNKTYADTLYYGITNPSGFYNVTNAPTYINDTFGANYSTYLTKPTWSIIMNGTLMLSANWNATNTSYYLASNPSGFYNSTNAPIYVNDTFAGNYSTFLTHIDWSKAINGTLMKSADWNSTNTSYYLVSNPSNYYNSTSAPIYINDTFGANYSTFLTHIDWAKAINGTLMLSANWNATNTSYMLASNWNATNTSYYLASNPSGFYNVTNAPIYVNDTFGANYSTYLTKPTWSTVMNGTLMLSANWNSTNTSYYLASNPSGFYNVTNAPIYINDTFSANYSTFLTHIDWAKAINGTLMKSADWNATNTSYALDSKVNSIGNWTADKTAYSTKVTADGLYYGITNPYGFYNSTNPPPADAETLWNANYSTYLTKPTWTIAMNGTLMKSADWNATNTSYMLASNWNATNTSYYLASNPSGFYNSTNAPIYINDTFSANYSTFLTHIDWAKAINGTLAKMTDLVNYNSSGLIKDWNASGLIRSYSASDWNSSGLIKDWNATGLIKTWTDTDTFVANYSTFLTHIDWAKAINGTLMKSADWNATNTSYYLATNPNNYIDWSKVTNGTLMLSANWNATNTSYYLASNPSGYYNSTNAPIYINDTFAGNYSNYLNKINWSQAINGTLMLASNWNATNTSYIINGSYASLAHLNISGTMNVSGNIYLDNDAVITRTGTNTSLGITSGGTFVEKLG